MTLTLMIFIAIVQAVLALGHFLLYLTLQSIFSFEGLVLGGMRLAAIILSVSFVVSSFLSFNYYNWWTKQFKKAAESWLGFAFYLLLSSVLYHLVRLVNDIFGL